MQPPTGALLCGLGALLVLAACEAKIPTSAEIAQMDVASAQKSASQAGFMRTPANNKTDFFLNGVTVSAERARAIEAKDIGSIEIVKSELPTAATRSSSPPLIGCRRTSRQEPCARLRPTGESKMGRNGAKSRTVRDSTEHLVAHVEGELASMRARTASASAPT